MANPTRRSPGLPIECGDATLRHYEQEAVDVVAVAGELDEAGVDEVGAHLSPLARPNPWILDLSEVRFVSVAGYRALLRWAYRAREVNANWAMVAGAAVQPYLRAGTRTQPMPVARTYSGALALLEARRHRAPAMSGFTHPARTQC